MAQKLKIVVDFGKEMPDGIMMPLKKRLEEQEKVPERVSKMFLPLKNQVTIELE